MPSMLERLGVLAGEVSALQEGENACDGGHAEEVAEIVRKANRASLKTL